MLRGLPGSHHPPKANRSLHTSPPQRKRGRISTFEGETILKNLLAPAAWLGRECRGSGRQQQGGSAGDSSSRRLSRPGAETGGGSGEGKCLQIPREIAKGALPGKAVRTSRLGENILPPQEKRQVHMSPCAAREISQRCVCYSGFLPKQLALGRTWHNITSASSRDISIHCFLI